MTAPGRIAILIGTDGTHPRQYRSVVVRVPPWRGRPAHPALDFSASACFVVFLGILFIALSDQGPDGSTGHSAGGTIPRRRRASARWYPVLVRSDTVLVVIRLADADGSDDHWPHRLRGRVFESLAADQFPGLLRLLSI